MVSESNGLAKFLLKKRFAARKIDTDAFCDDGAALEVDPATVQRSKFAQDFRVTTRENRLLAILGIAEIAVVDVARTNLSSSCNRNFQKEDDLPNPSCKRRWDDRKCKRSGVSRFVATWRKTSSGNSNIKEADEHDDDKNDDDDMIVQSTIATDYHQDLAVCLVSHCDFRIKEHVS